MGGSLSKAQILDGSSTYMYKHWKINSNVIYHYKIQIKILKNLLLKVRRIVFITLEYGSF